MIHGVSNCFSVKWCIYSNDGLWMYVWVEGQLIGWMDGWMDGGTLGRLDAGVGLSTG